MHISPQSTTELGTVIETSICETILPFPQGVSNSYYYHPTVEVSDNMYTNVVTF
jgi:hypothetical protein